MIVCKKGPYVGCYRTQRSSDITQVCVEFSVPPALLPAAQPLGRQRLRPGPPVQFPVERPLRNGPVWPPVDQLRLGSAVQLGNAPRDQKNDPIFWGGGREKNMIN